MEQFYIKNPDKLCKKSEVLIINGSNKNNLKIFYK